MTADLTIRADWLEASATQSVFAALEAGGFEARAVGGIVRNALLGLPATDIDIATTALPADTIRLARAAGLKTFETGLAHGTVTVVAEGVPFEVTTLRRDVVSDGRHALVVFTSDWAEDAARRDFTINALYCDRVGRVFDPLGGMADLEPVRVRFIGSASRRICEDYLRILRFFRFTAAYGADGVLDGAGLAACIAHAQGLSRISGERIQGELLKLFVARHGVLVAKALADSGVYSTLFGEAARFETFARLAAIETAQGRPPDGLLRFAALGVDSRAGAVALDRRLKLSARDRQRLLDVVNHRGVIAPGMDEEEAKRVLYRLGIAAFTDAVFMAWAESGRAADDALFGRILVLPERWVVPRFTLTGGDVCALGVTPGPRVGAILAELEADWIASGFHAGRGELLIQLRSRLAGKTE